MALIHADLRGAELSGADLAEAILTGAKLPAGFPAGATLCNTSMPGGSVGNPQPKC